MTARLSVDVGGTFTDLMYCDEESGVSVVAKGPTTPGAPDKGITALVRSSLSTAQLAAVSHFLHGSTVGINALLERTGAVVGMLTTAGFRDALEIRRGDRGEATYDILWRTPEPLVPRRLRCPVRERVAAGGSVLTPIDLADVRAAAAVFAEEGVESVAITFMNAYAAPEHEVSAAEALREAGFAGEISLSHLVSGELGLYERTSTTVIDAYVRPLMAAYLRDLATELGESGMRGECLITRSGGGALPFAEAGVRPFETIISGPVAGAMGAASLGAGRGIKYAITADAGGTSFDTCLIVDGRPQTKYQGEVLGMPIQSPWVDVRSVGAGGGSLASVDAGGLLRVGPQSAGAVPGPVCYGRGGTEPTVTDAAAVLGMLGEGKLAGDLILDQAAARTAVAGLGSRTGLDADSAAAGIIRIANAEMAAAVRTITVEQGIDPREAVLIAFGGAGPLFGALLADELGIRDTLVPVHAGNFSAVGLLGQGIARSAARTFIAPFGPAALSRAGELAAGLFAALPDGDERELAFDMRYAGQYHTLTIGVPNVHGLPGAGADGVVDLFTASYAATFGDTLPGPVEIVAVRATTRSALVEVPVPAGASVTAAPASVRAYSFRKAERVDFPVVERAALRVSEPVPGPLIVTEQTTTTYVDTGFTVEAQPDATLLIRNLEVPR
ncbi:hydantoinase/oxoprolinase family protein [Amycolatopsis jejuensis]|uniref:hydantoinase/oxoprolinase family protein n=1 Tax=Amycolatopsis jejuensis TaxID=330084 RepID=UPI000524C3C8|nr:hydantoinase/oxoprolinase family protein [Amycolatopsis jejuensis]